MVQTTACESRPPDAKDNGTPRWHALSGACGLTLHAYRPDYVLGRIARSVEREGVADLDGLTALLTRDTAARLRFRRSVAISVTGSFRDPDQFDLLSERVLPDLLGRGGTLRAWSAGCSNGLELLSLATLINRHGALGRTRLLGSDVLRENIEAARSGTAGDVAWPVALAAHCNFEVRDLITGGAPDGRFDLILCRNVGIYFEPDARSALMTMLAAALTPGGVLLLGRSERLIEPRSYGLEHHADHAYRSPR
jgi:chemotaxis protein methyltransferase CheR